MGTHHHGVSVCPSHVRIHSHAHTEAVILLETCDLTQTQRRNMAPTMCVPGINALSAEFHITSPSVSTLAVTIYVLGLAIGPMFTSPLSEIYGRLPVYHATNVVFLAFILGCALSQNFAEFMVFRFVSGFMGGTPMALGGGTIADVTRPEGRSTAMALFSLGPLTGPVSEMTGLLLTLWYPYPGPTTVY